MRCTALCYEIEPGLFWRLADLTRVSVGIGRIPRRRRWRTLRRLSRRHRNTWITTPKAGGCALRLLSFHPFALPLSLGPRLSSLPVELSFFLLLVLSRLPLSHMCPASGVVLLRRDLRAPPPPPPHPPPPTPPPPPPPHTQSSPKNRKLLRDAKDTFSRFSLLPALAQANATDAELQVRPAPDSPYISPCISHFSFLISHFSFLISHFSFLISPYVFLISHFSFLISHFSLRFSHFSFLISHFSLRFSRCMIVGKNSGVWISDGICLCSRGNGVDCCGRAQTDEPGGHAAEGAGEGKRWGERMREHPLDRPPLGVHVLHPPKIQQ
eukprot:COSAG05_NODE_5093_length_1264_cov_10.391416_2_plen_324_part_01